MFGSLKDAPCTKRLLHTICSQIAREQMGDDIAKTLENFKEMKTNDPAFQWSVERGEDNTTKTLMWCSGMSRELYACFGDVVTFDKAGNYMHAYKIYTKASFMLFRKQVDKATSYIVSGKGEHFYVVSHSSPGERPKWAKVDFKVYVLDDGARYYCECGFYEHLGILCCHAIRVSF